MLRRLALRFGVREDEVDDLWGRHVELVQGDGGDYGGPRWVGLCKRHVQDEYSAPIVKNPERDLRAARAREREAKILEDQAYERDAIPLTAYLVDIADRVENDPFARLTPLEKKLLDARPPTTNRNPETWLMGALHTAAGEPSPPRVRGCAVAGCPDTPESWRGWSGRVYVGPHCPRHAREEASERNEAKERRKGARG